MTARLTCSSPLACCWLAKEISPMMSATFLAAAPCGGGRAKKRKDRYSLLIRALREPQPDHRALRDFLAVALDR
ncbi:MAG TPA: hypothetical protein VJ303_11405, partial [Steroidobacteraceae bacterium]|nr:hypothetical protein [Steroidobacteraceae bacterium]